MAKRSDLWLVSEEEDIPTDAQKQNRYHSLLHSTRLMKITGTVCLMAAFLAVGLWYGSRAPSKAAPITNGSVGKQALAVSDTLSQSGKSAMIQVDVHGDVRHPGVVSVPANARVEDAIRAAGGFLHSDDAMNVNQAALVWDGEEIDIARASPSASAETNSTMAAVKQRQPNRSQTSGAAKASQRINLNSADAATLETLPGLGPTRAANIVSYRKTHGPFQSVSGLLQVSGIGEKSLAKWRADLYVPVQHSAGQS